MVLVMSCMVCHLKHTRGHLRPGVQPVRRVRATSNADTVVISPKSCRSVLHGQVVEYLVEETLGQLTGHYGKVVHSSRKVRYQHYIILAYRLEQVRDMTAFVIHYCIVTHIKITIQSLYCNQVRDKP